MDTKAEAAIRVLRAVVETIREAGAGGAPRGLLFASLASHGCTAAQYAQIEAILVESGTVVRRGDLLVAVGA